MPYNLRNKKQAENLTFNITDNNSDNNNSDNNNSDNNSDNNNSDNKIDINNMDCDIYFNDNDSPLNNNLQLNNDSPLNNNLQLNNDSPLNTSSSLDENGNLKGFIDYSDDSDKFELSKIKSILKKNNKRKIIDDSDDEDEDNNIKKFVNYQIDNSNFIEEDMDYEEDIDEDEDENSYCEDEIQYYNNVSQERKDVIDKMELEIKNIQKTDIPLRFKIIDLNIDINTKSYILSQLQRWQIMDSNETEYHKLNKWLETIQNIPFNKYTPNILDENSSINDRCNYILNIKDSLDKHVYGHNDAKMNILQYVSKCISNPKAGGNILAIQGPPGNGKTTLIKHGLCNAINKPFGFIGLGGTIDSSLLNGHDYTYEGSQYGKIAQILMKTKVMDPVIFMDELDKISESHRGDEISNLLCHIIDRTQNMSFEDRYLSGISLDLSRVTFIFSFNDESKINPILKDRLHIIRTQGFTSNDKIKIVKDYLLDEILIDSCFPKENIVIADEVIRYIIDKYTNGEAGVRELKRNIDTIITKLNLIYTLYSDENIKTRLGGFLELKNKYECPCILTNNMVDELLTAKNNSISKLMMYV